MRAQAGFLDALLAEMPEARIDGSSAAREDEVLTGIEGHRSPKGFKASFASISA